MSAPLPLCEALRAAEAALDDLTRERLAHPEREVHEAEARVRRAMATLGEAAPQPLSAELQARLDTLLARHALHARAVPGRVLEGLFEAVQAGAGADRWGRAGMSGAFLDAPRSLGRWRALAAAACVLLFAGGGLLSQARVSFDEPPGVQPLQDPRDELLPRLDAPAVSAASARRALEPVGDAVPVGHAPARRDGRGAPRRGVVSFHILGSGGVAGRISIDEVRVLDAAARRLRVPGPVRVSVDDDETN